MREDRCPVRNLVLQALISAADNYLSNRSFRAGAFSLMLECLGKSTTARLHWNLSTAPLVEHAVRRGEGLLAKDGPLLVRTGRSA
jgi:hypothetical protein